MLTPPLEAGTKLWGFQRGRASPLVKGGVKSPPAKWLRLIDLKISSFCLGQELPSGRRFGDALAQNPAPIGANPVGVR